MSSFTSSSPATSSKRSFDLSRTTQSPADADADDSPPSALLLARPRTTFAISPAPSADPQPLCCNLGRGRAAAWRFAPAPCAGPASGRLALTATSTSPPRAEKRAQIPNSPPAERRVPSVENVQTCPRSYRSSSRSAAFSTPTIRCHLLSSDRGPMSLPSDDDHQCANACDKQRDAAAETRKRQHI